MSDEKKRNGLLCLVIQDGYDKYDRELRKYFYGRSMQDIVLLRSKYYAKRAAERREAREKELHHEQISE